MATNIMALYNDSDSDSDNEFFTNNAHRRLTRNSNFTLRPKMYDEEEKAELVYTKDTRKFNPYNIMFDDNESVGSAFSIPKRIRQSTNADEVDSDNDFEPTMRGKRLVMATDDDIENFLDGNPVGQKEDNDGELDDYGSASDMEEGVGSASEGEEDGVLVASEAKGERRPATKPAVKAKAREEAKAQVRSVLAKVRSAKSKIKGAPVKLTKIYKDGRSLPALAGVPVLRDAVDIMVEAQPIAPPEAKKEEAKEEKAEAPSARQEKEADLRILEAKPKPTDPKEAEALKKAITNLKRLITRMKSQGKDQVLFRTVNVEEREFGKGKGSKKVFFNEVEITPAKMTLVKMKQALEEVKGAPNSKEKSRVVSKITRAISDRIKRNTSTGQPEEVIAPSKSKGKAGGKK